MDVPDNSKSTVFMSSKSVVCYGCGGHGHIKKYCKAGWKGRQSGNQYRSSSHSSDGQNNHRAHHRGSRGGGRAGFRGQPSYRGFSGNQSHSWR